MPLRLRLVLALATSVAVVVLGGPGAWAAWTEPKFISAAGSDANNPDVAMDLDGDALVVFNGVDTAGFNRIYVRPRTAAGVWRSASAPLSAAGQHATDAQVALDEDGDAVVVWLRSNGTNVLVQARARSKTGTFSSIATLSAPGQDAQAPVVAIDDDGDAIVAWYRSDGSNSRVEARYRSAAGVWGPTVRLSAAGRNAYSPQVAMSDGGAGIAVWYRFDGSDNRVQFRHRPIGGPWGPITFVSPANLNAEKPAVDMDQDGDAMIVWEQQDASSLQRINARARSKTGVLGSIAVLSDVTGSDPHVAMSPGGRPTAVWERATGPSPHVEASVRGATGWSAAKRLSDTPGPASAPRVAAGVGPRASAVWRRQDADGHSRVETRPWLSGTWRAFTTLSSDDADAAEHDVALEEAGGETIVVWRTSDGSSFRIEVSSGS